jgi:hypothetical protein
MNRREILGKAQTIIDGDRQKDYGDWSDNAEDIASMWTVILGSNVSARQVGLCMIALKMVRLKRGPHEDSFVDICGYAALGGESDD